MLKIEGNFRSYVSMFFLIGVSLMIVVSTVRNIAYLYSSKPIEIKAISEIGKLKDNAAAKVWIGLDMAKLKGINYLLSSGEYVLIPFQGSDYRLIYAIKGPITNTTFENLKFPYEGRVVTKGILSDSWDVCGKEMQLKELFGRDSINISDDALIICNSPPKNITPWEWTLFVLAIVYLLYKLYSLRRLLPPTKTVGF